MSKLNTREPVVTFTITFRNAAHFNTVVTALNKSAGHSAENWTMDGKVRKHLRGGNPVTRKVMVYNPKFDKEDAMYLSLI